MTMLLMTGLHDFFVILQLIPLNILTLNGITIVCLPHSLAIISSSLIFFAIPPSVKKLSFKNFSLFLVSIPYFGKENNFEIFLGNYTKKERNILV